MSIKIDEVKKVASLSRIKLSEEEELKFTNELSGIIDFFEILPENNISKTSPLTSSTELKNIIFQDKAKESTSRDLIIDNFPERKDDYLKTKPIIS